MKIDRRKFLSIGAGTVAGIGAGTVLSPIPWKLIDDSSIWTQNWPWTPIPKGGKVTHENSVCTLCPGKCGITVRKVGDRVVKIEGMDDHPVNGGGICLLGLSGAQLLYSPTRIKYPMKRVGARGDGKFQRISWNEAIKDVASRLSKIRSDGRPDTLACIVGDDQGTVPELFKRFLTAYGSSNFIAAASMDDSYEMVLKILHGIDAKPGFDFENADHILSFGSGLMDGWGSPVRMFKANSLWKNNGCKVTQIEPRLSNTAAKADKWIPITPGTESLLAIGIAYVIIKDSLYDKNFIKYRTTGFDVFKQFIVNKYSLDEISRKTGVDKHTIENVAKNFANPNQKSIALCGRGKGAKPGSTIEFMAVHLLNVLKGNINKKGGIYISATPDYIRWPEVIKDTVAREGIQQERIDGAGTAKYPNTKYLLNQLPEVINSKNESPIQALFVSGANPLFTMSGIDEVKKAFGKIPYVVSFATYKDETSQYADIILPNHCFLERDEDVPTSFGLTKPVISMSKPVVAPQFNTKHVGDSLIQIAKALKGNIADSFPWKGYKECLRQTLGSMATPLEKQGFYQGPGYMRPFAAPSNKFEFTAMIRYNEEPEAPRRDDLLLISYDSIRLASGPVGDPPFAIKTVSDTVLKGKYIFVEINPETAKKLRLSQGQTAILSTSKGSAKVKVNMFDGIKPGVIAMPSGLGHTAYDKYLAGKGVNVNKLIGPVADPTSGLDVAWGISAKLKKA
jgi:anaerobic selenocysteine-containing dehydrogenase